MNGSLKDASAWLKLLVVLITAIAGAMFFTLLGLILAPFFLEVSLEEMLEVMASNPSDMGGGMLKFLQGFATVGTFLVPGFMTAALFSNTPSRYLQIDVFPKKAWMTIGLVLLLTLSGTFISDFLYTLSKGINLPDSLASFQEYLERSELQMMELTQSFLKMNGFLDFAKVFLVMAILPAVSEETLFRGVVQPILGKATRSPHLAVIVTAFFFSLMHQQFYSFLSIFALGIVLGYLKEWSQSLWVPILMHLINNGAIVCAVYFWDIPMDEVNEASSGWGQQYFWIGITVFTASLVGIFRLFKRA